MKIINVETREIGTVAKRLTSNTAGLTSGYQRTSSSSCNVSILETAGGLVIKEISALPWYSPAQIKEPNPEINPESIPQIEEELALGYIKMADENRNFAEALIPLALEVWPSWEE